MNKKKATVEPYAHHIKSNSSLPHNIEELLEQLKTDDKIKDFASKLVKEYFDEIWAG